MKKKIIAGLLALLMLLSVVACGTEEAETSGEATSGAEAGESETQAPTETEEQPGTETEPETDPATEPGTESEAEPVTTESTETEGSTGTTAGSGTTAPVETETQGQAKTPVVDQLNVIENGRLTYTIMLEDVSAAYTDALTASRTHIRSKYGIMLSYKVLKDGVVRAEKEIVIGKSLDEITALVGADKIEKLDPLDFYLGTKGTKVYVAAGTPEAVSVALTYLMEQYYNTSSKTMTLPGNMAMKAIDATNTVIHGTETKIVIPGLTKTYKFIQVTDTHITLADADMGTGQKDDMTYFNERYNLFTSMAAETTGYGIAAHLRFPYFFRYAEQVKADMILMSGDIVDFPTDANVKLLKDSISKSKTPVMYTLGNHDWNNGKHYGDTYAVQNYIPRFLDIMGGDARLLEVKDMGEFMIVAMDNSMDSFTEVQITVLKQLCTQGKPIILMFHVPLYSPTLLDDTVKDWNRNILVGTTNGSINRNQWTGELENILKAENSPIVAVIAGHIHFDHTDRVAGNVIQYVGDDGHTNGNTRVYIVSGS